MTQATIREACSGDLAGLLRLYAQLHGEPMPVDSPERQQLWERILREDNLYIVVAEQEGSLVSTCTVVIVPNLTHGQRPYALVENVVTDAAYRRQGLAAACLAYARDVAMRAGCYKIMLLTGSRDPGTLHFYEQAGYNRHDKTGFIQWLE